MELRVIFIFAFLLYNFVACNCYLTCDFEDQTQCGFVSPNNSDVVWKRYAANEDDMKLIKDGSGNVSGHYMALNFDFGKSSAGDAVLQSQTLILTNVICISFSHYFMANNTVLDIYTDSKEDNGMNLVKSLTQDRDASSWKNSYFQIDIKPKQWLLKFIARYKDAKSGLIALDNIRISSGKCKNVFACDFEEECLWKSLESKKTSSLSSGRISLSATNTWERHLASSLPSKINDHTFRKRNASVLAFVSAKSFFSFLTYTYIGIYKSVTFQMPKNQAEACLTFSHYFEGNHELLVFVGRDDQNIMQMSTIEGDKTKKWRVSKIDLKPKNEEFYIYIVGIIRSHNVSFIAIDDIAVSLTECKTPEKTFRCKSSEMIPESKVCDFKYDCFTKDDEENCANCTFDQSYCGYKNNGFQLVGYTNTSYIKAKSRESYRKWIESPTLRNSKGTCTLTFDYYMNDCLRLEYCRIIVQLVSKGNIVEIWHSDIFTLAYDVWQKVVVGIGAVNEFTVKIIATYAKSYHDRSRIIAFDNVFFNNCSFPLPSDECRDEQFKCKNGVCIDKQFVCDFENDCGDASDEVNCGNYLHRCDFENGYCDQWKNQSWYITNGYFNIKDGSTRDHTIGSGSGHFVHYKWKEDNSLIFNRDLKRRRNCYLRFYYVLRSVNGQLNVTVSYGNKDQVMETFTNSGQLNFRKAIVDLYKVETDSLFQLRFQAMIYVSYTEEYGESYVAIDDISFTPECFIDNNVTTTTETPPDYGIGSITPPIIVTTEQPGTLPLQFVCPPLTYPCRSVKKCYTSHDICNFVNDCGDNTDEEECGTKCDFESKCGWFNSNGYSDQQWDVFSGPGVYRNFGTGPASDHTLGEKCGHYLATNRTQNAILPGRIVYRSLRYQATGSKCNLHFYYHIYGTKTAILSVEMNVQNTNYLLWSDTGDKGDQWLPADIHIGNQTRHFYLAFVATINKPAEAVTIALDDIELLHCATNEISCAADELRCADNSTCYKEQENCNGVNECKDGSDEMDCFDCKNGSLIPISKVCNFKFDCAEKVDEENCGDCDFESNLCGYTNDGFEIVEEQFLNNQLIVFQNTESNSATITSPWLRKSSSNCSLEFKYKTVLHSSSNSSFIVSLHFPEAEGEKTPEVIFKNFNISTKNNWARLSLNIGSNNIFRISFEVKVAYSTSELKRLSFFAIDDIQLKRCD